MLSKDNAGPLTHSMMPNHRITLSETLRLQDTGNVEMPLSHWAVLDERVRFLLHMMPSVFFTASMGLFDWGCDSCLWISILLTLTGQQLQFSLSFLKQTSVRLWSEGITNPLPSGSVWAYHFLCRRQQRSDHRVMADRTTHIPNEGRWNDYYISYSIDISPSQLLKVRPTVTPTIYSTPTLVHR